MTLSFRPGWCLNPVIPDSGAEAGGLPRAWRQPRLHSTFLSPQTNNSPPKNPFRSHTQWTAPIKSHLLTAYSATELTSGWTHKVQLPSTHMRLLELCQIQTTTHSILEFLKPETMSMSWKLLVQIRLYQRICIRVKQQHWKSKENEGMPLKFRGKMMCSSEFYHQTNEYQVKEGSQDIFRAARIQKVSRFPKT